MESRLLMTGTLTPLVNSVPNGSGTAMLETNGTVIMQGGGVSKEWFQLTPDASGNYVDGTWTQLASMSTNRLYFGSVILPDGRMFVQGGEYSGPAGGENDSPSGEIYNPATNRWTSVAPFPQDNFGDDSTILLGNGQILAGYLLGPQTYLYNPTSNTWTRPGRSSGMTPATRSRSSSWPTVASCPTTSSRASTPA